MEARIIEILQTNFKGQDINNARKELCLLFGIKRTDEPKCPKCKASADKQSMIGEWEDGAEYRCDNCNNEWEYEHFI
jgi:transposase-like protein